jgi:hypothetical protein
MTQNIADLARVAGGKSLIARTKLTKPQAKNLRDEMIEDLRAAGDRLVRAAVKLDAFVKGKGWIPLGYKTMTEWREQEISSSEFYNLRYVNKLLVAGVPPEMVSNMKLTNIDVMVRELPQSAWLREEWQRKAIDMPVADFCAHVRAEAKEVGTVVEEMHRRGFIGPASLIKNWDLAMRVAESIDGANSMESRIDAIIANYLNSESGVAGKSKLQRYEEIFQELRR